MLMYALCNYINGVSMTCTPENLLNLATLAGYLDMSVKNQYGALVYLMCNLAGGGGGGGNAQFVTYTVAPPASPTNTAQPALAYDPTGNLPTLGWNTANQTWN